MRTVPDTSSLCRPSGTAAQPAPLGRALLAIIARPRRRMLDMRTLSDHLKRDIGWLDGNDPRGPRP